MNGERTISAELVVTSSDEPFGSLPREVEFDNADGYVVEVDLGDNERYRR